MKKSIPFFLLALLAFCAGCTRKTGTENKLAFKDRDIKVQWELISNYDGDRNTAKASFIVGNHSNYILSGKGWAMFFNQFDVSFQEGTQNAPVIFENLGGDFCSMSPTEKFEIKPGDSMVIQYEVGGSMIKNTDGPQGVYFVFYDAEGRESQRLAITDYSILPYTRPEQMNRSKRDRVPIVDAQYLFNEYKMAGILSPATLPPFLPIPKSYKYLDGHVMITQSSVIHFEAGLEKEVEYLNGLMEKLLGSKLKIEQSKASGKGIIKLGRGPVKLNSLKSEAYKLEVTPDHGIVITGIDRAGVFYGIIGLEGMCPVTAFQNPVSELNIKAVMITDGPAFSYRGQHIDVARDFNKKEAVLKLIDVMALYKLNRLHFHITDDEGWRVEIKGLPELTEVGAKRGHTLTDEEYLHPSYGSGPDPDPSVSYGTGYYSREEFKEILVYAQARHISVIPEIEMPGHARAAIKSMEARYKKYMAEGKKDEAEFYRLIDPDDQSEYTSAQNYHDNVVCVVREGVYNFYAKVLEDIMAMYNEAGVPLVMWNVAGDEVPSGAWEKSPLCAEFLKNNTDIKNPKELQPYFFRKIIKMISEKGLPVSGWEEMAMKPTGDGKWIPNPEFSGKQIYPLVWNSIRGNTDLSYKLANGGYPVILCNVTNFYFDLSYNKDPREPGLYWGGFVDTKDAFRFAPYDLFQSVVDDATGKTMTDEEIRTLEKLKPTAKKNIVGIQGQLWSETIKGEKMLEYDYLPKLLGMAYSAWNGQPEWAAINNKTEKEKALEKSWNIFLNLCALKEFPRLDNLSGGYNYRLSPPGIMTENGKIIANTEYPGMEIRYTTDGSEPSANSAKYEGAFEAKGLIKMKTFNPVGRGSLTTELVVK